MTSDAHRLMYDNIHDFKATAALIESDIRRLALRDDNDDLVPGAEGKRRHRDMWVSMKTVSHFNLGIALELMLKMILTMNRVQYRNKHELVYLYELLPAKFQTQLESTYRGVSPKRHRLVAFANSATRDGKSLPPLVNRDLTTLRRLLEYFDEDVLLSKKRYSSEHVSKGQWRHYMSDLSPFIALIDSVMINVPRE